MKKTKRGRIIKIVREHYLRDDITCGSEICEKCDVTTGQTPLPSSPALKSKLCGDPHYLIPDTNVVLHQVSKTTLLFLNTHFLLRFKGQSS